MRTTLNTIYSRINTNLGKITTDMGKINDQISSGMQMSKLSEEPVNLVSALRFRSTVVELDQYTENIQSGNTIITAAESALTQMKDLSLRAKTLAIQATDPGYTAANREAIAEEIKNMFEQAVSLANTQVNGKYIFGGFRTEGYTEVEPAPFMVDKGDGYWINGMEPVPLTSALTTGTIQSTDLASGNLLINGMDIGAVDLTPALGNVSGLNMRGAAALKGAINLYAGRYANSAATADTNDGIDSIFSFDLNGVPIDVTILDNSNATAVSNTLIAALNLKTADTGVTAFLGDGTNGGPTDSVVFANAQAGDNSPITVTNFTTSQQGGADLGFDNFSQKIVQATLTTQVAGIASSGAAGGEAIDFTINGVQVAYTATTGGAASAAMEAVTAINAVSAETGVTAVLGTGSNGGPASSVVLKNSLAGEESAITVAGVDPGDTAVTGLSDMSFRADDDLIHNTGKISLTSANAISITSSTTDDTILDRIGLGGGSLGNFDAAADGQLVYGYPLTSGELKINGFEVPATATDGVSDVYADASAAAKATAINSINTQTGVTAVAIPAQVNATAAVSGGTETERLTGVVTNNGIAGSQLAINGTLITTAINIPAGAVNNGLNTDAAFSAQAAINAISATTGVSARLTTLYAGSPAAIGATQAVSFDINNVTVSVNTGGVSTTATASDIVNAINAVSLQTGVKAVVGNGITNGGALDSIVLSNVIKGNENDIVLANLDAGEQALIGLSSATYSVDTTNNTGEISLESDNPFTISSPTTLPPSDIYLLELGLTSTDVTGQIISGSTPKHLEDGDLTINGVNIVSIPTAISGKDPNNVLLDAINAKTSQTGVQATRGEDGSLRLTAGDGRNIHIVTSANGEAITHLTGDRRDLVTFGSLQLRSDRKFILETVDPSINANEPGLAALGLAGGATNSSEPDDVAADGRIDVFSIHNRTGTVRYAGDRINDLEIKIGKTNTMIIGENGKTGVIDTTIFSTLKALENYLRGENFTTVTGIHSATDTSSLLNSKTTGLEPESQLPDEDLFTNGTFTVSVTDHDYYPARTAQIAIAVDTTIDSLNSITSRIDGIPHLNASWTDDGQLKIESDNPDRYTIALTNDSSNFLKATGVSSEFMQSEGIFTSIADLDTLMEKLTQKVSDFGSRANRIDIQSQIYSTMIIATKENLSEVQDTDMIKAIMDLKAKETAYQAALSAASKTMQLSLVDYLR